MVTRLIFLSLLLSSFLFSGEFTASVDHNQINLGESFTLNLMLKGASAKGNPAIDALKKSFFIHSQQQSFNTVVINGQFTSSTTWKLTLTPQKEGEAIIPSLSIESSDGTLSSMPITIQVVKNAVGSHSSEVDDLTLTTHVSTAKPYKNEPIIYTIKLISKRDLANLQMQKINIEDAIVESNGEPKIYEKIVEGINVGIIEFSYFITPLKAGPLKIPSSLIQGGIATRRNAHNRSFVDDEMDLFSMMQGFNRLKPFGLATEEVILDVQPAIAGMIPWLPAKSLKIEEVWNDSQPPQAGEPLTRSFKIVAEGIKSTQLPSLNDLQISDNLFKVYADKPELGNEVKDGNIKSYRKEQYTLIPQQAGNLTLPEISIAWWDVTKKEKAIASIPSRTLQVLPAPDNKLNSQMIPSTEDTLSAPESQTAVIQRDPLFYALIAGLSLFLVIAIVWGIALQKKIKRLTEIPVKLKNTNQHEKQPPHIEPKKKSSASHKKEKLPDLNPT